MKKTLIAVLGALSMTAFAEPADPAPCAEGETPKRPPMEENAARPKRLSMPKPPMLIISEKTTAEDLAAFKTEVLKKIDETFAAYTAKPEAEGEKKRPVRLVLFSNEGMGPRPGMGPRGEGRGPRAVGKGPRGEGRGRRFRGERKDRAPAPEKPADAAE